MANYKGHVAGAAVFSVIYLAILSLVFAIDLLPNDNDIFRGFVFPITLVALGVLFGLFPDVDTNSKGQNIFYPLFFGVDLWLIVSGNFEEAAYLGLLAMLPILGKHRGWTHSKLAMLAVPLPLLVLPALNNSDDPWVGLPYYGAAVVGYFSHLYFDGLIIKRKRRR